MKLIFPTVIAYLLLINCNSQKNNTITINGNAQGTTYQIIYISESNVSLQKGIDSILKRIDSSLSTYLSASIISRVNNNDSTGVIDEHFINVFNKAFEVWKTTNGSFDPTVAPLINAWGFGFTKKSKVDSFMVDSLLDFIGYHKVRLLGKKVIKDKPGVMLDFNAIAQGYTVDVLANYLENMSVVNYLVELGGEVKARGKKQNDQYWTIGIDQPNEHATEGRPLKAVITLKDKALATSGNYRKFYIEDGKKFSHIIDPFTGYPAKHNLLSATVVANDCITADAYATSFMVMGMEKAKIFLSEHQGLQLDVFFIYDEGGMWKTYTSKKLQGWIKEIP